MPTTTPVLQPQNSSRTFQVASFSIYFLLNILSLIIINLNAVRLRSKNRSAKKMAYLFLFLLHYSFGRLVFRRIHTLIATGVPLLCIPLFDWLLDGITIVGLTGGIACGKSTVVTGLKTHFKGMVVIDCDEINRKLSLPDHQGYIFIRKLLGNRDKEFLEIGGNSLNRQKLSQLAFNDAQFRKKLTAGMGKLIFKQIFKDLFKAIVSGKKLILIDAPILYETKVLQYVCFPVVVVHVDQQTQIKRLCKRNNYTRQEALARINSQMPLKVKVKKANLAICNDASPQQTVQACVKGLQKFLRV